MGVPASLLDWRPKLMVNIPPGSAALALFLQPPLSELAFIIHVAASPSPGPAEPFTIQTFLSLVKAGG